MHHTIRHRTLRIGAVVLALGFVTRPAVAQTAPDGSQALLGGGCAACHGPRGEGSALAPAITGTRLSLAQFTAAVRTARGAMPAFGEAVLSDSRVGELHALLAAAPEAVPPSGRIEIGGERFAAVGCYACHANQGQGGTQGPRIGPLPLRWERFVWYVRHPSGQMPPYTDVVLSEQDLADIYAFLAARPAPRPLAEISLLAP